MIFVAISPARDLPRTQSRLDRGMVACTLVHLVVCQLRDMEHLQANKIVLKAKRMGGLMKVGVGVWFGSRQRSFDARMQHLFFSSSQIQRR